MNEKPTYKKIGPCKGYVFISHSHKDIDIVRIIRNKFEENNFEPILFYLKCMDNSSSTSAKTLEKLIHNEIDSRDYFLYLKSINSENSNWVQNELKYIMTTNPLSIKEINIEHNLHTILSQIDTIINNRNIHLCYSDKNISIIKKIYKKFVNSDFCVSPVISIFDKNNNKKSNKRKELLLVVITKEFTADYNLLKKLDHIFKLYSNIFLVYIGETDNYMNSYKSVNNISELHLSEEISQKDINFLFNKINNRTIDIPWGPKRKMYNINEIPPQHAVFNSLMDNPSIGDERNFCRIRNVKSNKYVNTIYVTEGETYEIFIYYHNCADTRLDKNDGWANKVKVTCNFPSHLKTGEQKTINAKIFSENTVPPSVWSGLYLLSQQDIEMKYVEDSALIHNGGKLNNCSARPKFLFTTGIILGYNKISGTIPGGFEYAGNITFQLKAQPLNKL